MCALKHGEWKFKSIQAGFHSNQLNLEIPTWVSELINLCAAILLLKIHDSIFHLQNVSELFPLMQKYVSTPLE